MNLTAADILRYWSLLTTAQRTAFLETKLPELIGTGQGADLVARAKLLLSNDTLLTALQASFTHSRAWSEQ